MEVIEPKDGEHVKPEGAGDAGQPAQERPPLYGVIQGGWMTMTVNLELLSTNPALMDQFMGFMERHKTVGINIMANMAQQRAQLKAAVMKTQQKNGFSGFLDKLRRR